VAFAVGGGDGNVRLAEPGLPARTASLHDFLGKGPATFALDVEIGATLGPRLLLGGRWTAFGAAAVHERPDGQETLALGIANLAAVTTFFPLERGPFLKAGAGLSRLATQRTPPRGGTETRSALGGNVALGAGYALWLGERFNLSLNLDWSGQAYLGDEFERSSFWRVGLGFAWY
jgi:hypothetical protein